MFKNFHCRMHVSLDRLFRKRCTSSAESRPYRKPSGPDPNVAKLNVTLPSNSSSFTITNRKGKGTVITWNCDGIGVSKTMTGDEMQQQHASLHVCAGAAM